MKRKNIAIICLLFIISPFARLQAQEIDLENIGSRTMETLKKNPLKIGGGISTSAIFYNSNQNDSRDNFTYFLNGNLNVGIYNWSIPISYSLTNQGSELGYDVPWKFNRISINPKYKWAKAYIGDASMTFSPYTLNGLMFTGGGIELIPDIPLKMAAMAGRLNKAVEDNSDPRTVPAYERMGYGMQLKWEKERYKLGLTGFYAKDDLNSLHAAPDTKGVLPQENLVLSLAGSFKPYKTVEVYVEYANSSLTNDLRAEGSDVAKGLSAAFLGGNSSTQSNNALNGGVNVSFSKGTIGIRYERIDPQYRTLGAYYFNNDLENITLNAAFSLLKDKLQLAGNIGREIDNLDNSKLQQNSRWVGSANINLKASEKIIISAGYSNFTSFTNKQLNQFTNINKNPLDIQQPLDSIDYKQVSQNANLNVGYNICQTEKLTQNLNFNYTLNDVVNRENGVARKGGITRFHNSIVSYALGLPKNKISIAASLNYTNSYTGSETMNILGPSLTVNKSFLENKLTATFGALYNNSTGGSMTMNVTNLRIGANYSPWKRHNFNATVVQMFRKTNQQENKNPNLNEMTATVGYNYSF